jgi:hypothetical protein
MRGPRGSDVIGRRIQSSRQTFKEGAGSTSSDVVVLAFGQRAGRTSDGQRNNPSVVRAGTAPRSDGRKRQTGARVEASDVAQNSARVTEQRRWRGEHASRADETREEARHDKSKEDASQEAQRAQRNSPPREQANNLVDAASGGVRDRDSGQRREPRQIGIGLEESKVRRDEFLLPNFHRGAARNIGLVAQFVAPVI